MRSNYKKIGDHIRLIDERNTGHKITKLLGLTILKKFIPSVANTIGTDMENYKVIRKNQFAASVMQVRRDGKMPVALLKDFEEAIISQAYPVFEVKNENELLPEYLMMWFARAEFDREACFNAVGGVRGSLEWSDFCEMKLPIPSITKQREIVAEYNTIQDRIKLNEQLIQKLEETAQAIYKQWFVDFEFSNEEGKPYKSSGGEMVECEKKIIPDSWRIVPIQTLIDEGIIHPNQDGNHGEIHPKSADFVKSGIPFVMANDLSYGSVDLENCAFISNVQAKKLRIGFSKPGDVLLTHKATMGRIAIVPVLDGYIVLTPQVTYYRVKDQAKISKEFLYCLFNSFAFQTTLVGDSEQSTRSYVGITNQRLIEILFPPSEIINSFTEVVRPLLVRKEVSYKELVVLKKISHLLLSKLATLTD